MNPGIAAFIGATAAVNLIIAFLPGRESKWAAFNGILAGVSLGYLLGRLI